MLKRNDKSYSDNNPEHRFDNENIKKVKCRVNSIYRNVALHGGEDEAQKVVGIVEEIIKIVSQEAEIQLEKALIEESERRRTNRKRRILLFLFLLFIMIIATFTFEYFQQKNEWGIWNASKGIAKDIVVVFVGIILGILANGRSNCSKETFTEGLFNEIKKLGNIIKGMRIFQAFILCMLIICVGALFARMDVFAKVSTFLSGGYLAVTEELTEDTTLVKKSFITKEAKEYLENNDAKLVKTLEKVYISHGDLMYNENLSVEDYSMIFFANGEYVIADWENQEHINQVVLRMVEELQEEKAENIFDKDYLTQGGAPPDVCNMISWASENECKVEELADLNYILGIRTDAYVQYPKKSIASLISDDYHELALVYALNGGNEDTVVYYYGQSIRNNFECLKFVENSDETIKDRLKRISQRYTDIRFVCPEHENSDEAEKLAVAFKNAENQY